MKTFCTLASILITAVSLHAQTSKTIAVLPAVVNITGNIPNQLRNDENAQKDIKINLGRQNQTVIANALVRQNMRRKNRKLGIQIITPQAKGYDAQYIIAPRMQMNMIMNPRTASMINSAAFAINFNTRFNAPYVPANTYNGDFNLIKAGTDQVLWNRSGSIQRKARRLFRYMRKNNL
jgi:hypothetical protein